MACWAIKGATAGDKRAGYCPNRMYMLPFWRSYQARRTPWRRMMRTERGVSVPCHSGPSGDTARREIPNFLVIAWIGSSSAR